MNTPNDFVDDLGLLALGSRMRRLSDAVMSDGTRIYRDLGIEFAPRWFPLLRLLAVRAPIGVTDAADALGLTQPAVSQFAREMTAAELVAVDGDPRDERRRLLSLTATGVETVARLQSAWRWIEAAVTEIAYEAEADMLFIMRRLEGAMKRKGLYERTMQLAAAGRQPVEIVDFTSELRGYWRSISAEWVAREYVLEPGDELLLDHPEREVLDRGGAIIFARVGEQIVGTCGLAKLDAETFELIKMGVTPAARGLGVGRKLGERVIAIARERGARRVVLETNHRARAAIQLYRSLGFTDTPPFGASLSRTDTYMALDLERSETPAP